MKGIRKQSLFFIFGLVASLARAQAAELYGKVLENELGARRIAQNHTGRLERDARILGRY